MEKIKLGIVGAGWVARQHIKVIKASSSLEVAGITSRTMSDAIQFAKDYEITVCADTLESLIAQAKPDGLLILVSEDQTYDVVSKAIPYGLPLFIEKPAGLSPKDNLALADLAGKFGVSSMVGLNRRYYSIFHKGLEIIREHGPLFGISIEGHERIWKVHQIESIKKDILRHWIFANSVHTIDLLRFFGGETVKVTSIAYSHSEPRGDQFAALLEFESGTIGQYCSYWHSPGGWRVVLYGNGVLVDFKPLENGIWIDKDFKTHPIEPDAQDVNFKTGFYKQMLAFEKLIRTKQLEWPAQDLNGAYKSMLLAESLSSNIVERKLV